MNNNIENKAIEVEQTTQPASKPAGKRGRPAGKPASKPAGKRGKRAVKKKTGWNKWIEFATTHNVNQVKNMICNCSYKMQLKILYAFGIAQLINTKRQIDVLSDDNKQRIKDLMEDFKSVY